MALILHRVAFNQRVAGSEMNIEGVLLIKNQIV